MGTGTGITPGTKGMTHGQTRTRHAGMGNWRVQVQVQPKVPMGYPWCSLTPCKHVNNTWFCQAQINPAGKMSSMYKLWTHNHTRLDQQPCKENVKDILSANTPTHKIQSASDQPSKENVKHILATNAQTHETQSASDQPSNEICQAHTACEAWNYLMSRKTWVLTALERPAIMRSDMVMMSKHMVVLSKKLWVRIGLKRKTIDGAPRGALEGLIDRCGWSLKQTSFPGDALLLSRSCRHD